MARAGRSGTAAAADRARIGELEAELEAAAAKRDEYKGKTRALKATVAELRAEMKQWCRLVVSLMLLFEIGGVEYLCA